MTAQIALSRSKIPSAIQPAPQGVIADCYEGISLTVGLSWKIRRLFEMKKFMADKKRELIADNVSGEDVVAFADYYTTDQQIIDQLQTEVDNWLKKVAGVTV